MLQNSKLHSVLDNARTGLLDLSTRNRLLSTSRTSRSSRLEVVDELSEETFRHLVKEGKSMGFLPKPEGDSESDHLFDQPEDDEENGLATRHTDDKLQTELISEKLQRRLLKLFYDARTFEEEQGVNILYLALGFLKWYEDDKSDRERFAPLILVPVELSRRSATSRFKIKYTEDDITTNLSLQARLKSDFGILLPEVPEDDEISPEEYFDAVSNTIRDKRRWEVLRNDMVLWFFSFSKFLMYRDLEPASWPEGRKLENHTLISSILDSSCFSNQKRRDFGCRVEHGIAKKERIVILLKARPIKEDNDAFESRSDFRFCVDRREGG